jgi:uncharacterized membrane protein
VKTGSRIVRLLLWTFALLLSVSACSRSGALAPAPDFSNPDSRLRTLAQWAVVILEGAGIGVILFGAIVATLVFLYRILRGRFSWGLYHRYREHLGEVILLGLEFLVAGDIVGTVALSLRMENVLSLAAIIIVRTFLSFTLEVETTGYWPWQRGGQSRHGVRERIQQKKEDLGSQPEKPALD